MNKEKIGLWGGCFNPISNTHISLAINVLEDLKLDKIYFVPVGDYYEKSNLEKAEHRYNMIKLAINGIKKLNVDDIELKSKTKLYAKDAFSILERKYINKDIYFIMGSDNFIKMPNWKDYDEIIKKYKYIVINRKKYEINKNLKENIIYYNPKQLDLVNSTEIRKSIKNKEKIEKYINKEVYNYIMKNELYKN